MYCVHQRSFQEKLSMDLIKIIVSQVVEDSDQELLMAHNPSSSLPQNGIARENQELFRLMLVNQEIKERLTEFLWKRVSVVRLCDGRMMPIKSFESLYQSCKSNRWWTKDLKFKFCFTNKEIDQQFEEVDELMKLIEKFFRSVRFDRIENLSIVFKLPSNSEIESNHPLNLRFREQLRISSHYGQLTHLQIECHQHRHLEFILAQTISQLKLLISIKITLSVNRPYQRLVKVINDTHLGQALASCDHLKILSLHGFQSINSNWIDLEWKSPLEDLTILTSSQTFTTFELLHFLNRFRTTISNLELDGMIEEDEGEEVDYDELNCLVKVLIQLKKVKIHQCEDTQFDLLEVLSLAPRLEELVWVMDLRIASYPIFINQAFLDFESVFFFYYEQQQSSWTQLGLIKFVLPFDDDVIVECIPISLMSRCAELQIKIICESM